MLGEWYLPPGKCQAISTITEGIISISHPAPLSSQTRIPQTSSPLVDKSQATQAALLQIRRSEADEGLTPADEAGSVVLRQPPASKLANLFRIDVRDHALGLVTQQLGGRVTEHPPGEWLGPRTPSLREGPGSASVASGSPDPVAGTGARGAALRSWHAGAVQFTAKICGLVGLRHHGRSSQWRCF